MEVDVEEENVLVVAQVLAPHGVAGELKCRVVTDYPEQRFKRGSHVHLGGERRRIRSARLVDGGHVLLKLEGIDSREAALAQRGAEVVVPKAEAVALPEGQFFWHQVIGLRVEDPRGAALGTVRTILETGANDVYVLDGPLGEVLVPAIRDVVLSIDPAAGLMVVEPLPGMLPEPRAAKSPRPRRPKR